MRKSCYFDAGDNYSEARAKCLNISDRQDRNECFNEAIAETGEEIELCGDQLESRLDTCEALGEDRYDPDPLADEAITFLDPDEITVSNRNPYFSIVAGHSYVLRAGDEGEEIVVVTVTDEVREVYPDPDAAEGEGLLCRIVVDAVVIEEEVDPAAEEDGESVEYIPVEITDDWYVQDTNRNLYYCGELSRNFDEDERYSGLLRDLDGSFETGVDRAKGGVLILAAPAPGDIHRQEYALGEAEDIAQYVALNTGPGPEEGGDVQPYACGGMCLKTFEYAPLEPDAAEYKYWLAGTGFVLGVGLDEDGNPTGARDELVCFSDSLDELFANPDCEFNDAGKLREELCELAPDAFCVDSD
jgi:hypothetical protein